MSLSQIKVNNNTVLYSDDLLVKDSNNFIISDAVYQQYESSFSLVYSNTDDDTLPGFAQNGNINAASTSVFRHKILYNTSRYITVTVNWDTTHEYYGKQTVLEIFHGENVGEDLVLTNGTYTFDKDVTKIIFNFYNIGGSQIYTITSTLPDRRNEGICQIIESGNIQAYITENRLNETTGWGMSKYSVRLLDRNNIRRVECYDIEENTAGSTLWLSQLDSNKNFLSQHSISSSTNVTLLNECRYFYLYFSQTFCRFKVKLYSDDDLSQSNNLNNLLIKSINSGKNVGFVTLDTSYLGFKNIDIKGWFHYSTVESPQYVKYITYYNNGNGGNGGTTDVIWYKDNTYKTEHSVLGFNKIYIGGAEQIYLNCYDNDNKYIDLDYGFKIFYEYIDKDYNTDSYIKFGNVLNKPYSFSGKSAYFFGDSITAGYTHLTPGGPQTVTENSWPKYFCDSLNMTFRNLAQGGQTVVGENGICNLIKETDLNCDFVFIAGGSNDFYSQVELSTFEEVYDDMCNYLKNNYYGEVFLMIPIWRLPDGKQEPYITKKLEAYCEIIYRLGIKYEMSIINCLDFNFPKHWNSLYEYLLSDDAHPTEQGYRHYAKCLRTVLC